MIEPRKYYGKYRGTVLNTIDPMQLGRIQVMVPDVHSLAPTTWAMPSFPVSGRQMGIWALPELGTGVWVEFEQGNPDDPIWTGCWFGSAAEVPALALATPPPLSSFVWQTSGKHVFAISDAPGPAGGILLRTTTGAMIKVDDLGITISNGKGATISLEGPTVSLNGSAFAVT